MVRLSWLKQLGLWHQYPAKQNYQMTYSSTRSRGKVSACPLFYPLFELACPLKSNGKFLPSWERDFFLNWLLVLPLIFRKEWLVGGRLFCYSFCKFVFSRSRGTGMGSLETSMRFLSDPGLVGILIPPWLLDVRHCSRSLTHLAQLADRAICRQGTQFRTV